MKENDIRPDKIFNKYLKLAENDCNKFFFGNSKVKVSCPVHKDSNGEELFVKNGFNYRKCKFCDSIFVSPRHNIKNYENFYLNGESVKFWSQEFYKKTEEARREKLWKPKVEELCSSEILDLPIQEYSIIDIGGGYGVFAELIKQKNPNNVLVVEPNRELAQVCKKKGINVIQKFSNELKLDELPSGPKIITSFELFEHLYNPYEFIESLRNIMKTGDILYLTTLTSSGIDIKVLKEKSKAITPPHHINFISVKGAYELLKNFGFGDIKISTPGKLDIDILKKQKNDIKDDIVTSILNNFDEDSLEKLQKLISTNNMSSHLLIKAKL